jgi:hypothetical protein
MIPMPSILTVDIVTSVQKRREYFPVGSQKLLFLKILNRGHDIVDHHELEAAHSL